jgi:hypothetical protein
MPTPSTNDSTSTETGLYEATETEIAQILEHGLLYDGDRRVHHADRTMAGIVAEQLVAHLRRSGFVLMRRRAMAAPSTTRHMP